MPTSPQRAQQIMGANFLGTEAVRRHFAVDFRPEQDGQLRDIPFSEQTLTHRRKTHLLVAGYPLSIHDLRARAPKLLHDAEQPWYAGQPFAESQVSLRWYLIRRGIVPGSATSTWQEQREMLAREEVPRACELVYATLLYFLVRGIRLFDRGEFARSHDTIQRYGNLVNAGVMAGTFEKDGLRLGGLWWDYRLHYVGVASMQSVG